MIKAFGKKKKKYIIQCEKEMVYIKKGLNKNVKILIWKYLKKTIPHFSII